MKLIKTGLPTRSARSRMTGHSLPFMTGSATHHSATMHSYIIGFGHAGADFLQHPGSLYHLVDDGTLFLHICIRIQDQPVEQHRFCIGRSGQVDVSDQFFIRLLILCLQHFQRHMFPVLL